MVFCSSTAWPGRSVSCTIHSVPYTRSMFPTQTEPLPSRSVAKATSTGEVVIQLWETGKLNSTPNAAHAPR